MCEFVHMRHVMQSTVCLCVPVIFYILNRPHKYRWADDGEQNEPHQKNETEYFRVHIEHEFLASKEVVKRKRKKSETELKYLYRCKFVIPLKAALRVLWNVNWIEIHTGRKHSRLDAVFTYILWKHLCIPDSVSAHMRASYEAVMRNPLIICSSIHLDIRNSKSS